MYSVMLVMAMTSDAPQGLLLHRHRSTGCAGTVAVSATGCSGSKAAVPTGCAGTAAAYGTAPVAGPVKRALLHREVLHAINVKERSGELSSADAARARAVLRDPELRGAALAAMRPVAAAGDHPFLEWLMHNWKDILTTILALFGK